MYRQIDRNYKPFKLNAMDKLIKDLDNLIYEGLCDYPTTVRLFSILTRYRLRQHRAANSFTIGISSDQWGHINTLIDDARERFKLLPDDCGCFDELSLDELSLQDAYRLGFINAVLRLMKILGIDESRVKQ